MTSYDDMLSRAGIDPAAGLKLTGGKRERYESILRKFAVRQAVAADAIRAALDKGDVAAAERDAHSLKGAASTLGVNLVAQQAGAVEMAIREGRAADEALSSLARSLDEAMAAIRAALPDGPDGAR